MAVGGYGNVASTVTLVGGSTTPTIFNIVVGTANVEVSQALPLNTKEFILRSRGGGVIKLAYMSGDSATLYLTIPQGTVYQDQNYYSGQTIYFQSSIVDIIELVCYA